MLSKIHLQRLLQMSNSISVWSFVLCTTFCMRCINFPFPSKISIQIIKPNPLNSLSLNCKHPKANQENYKQKRQANSRSQKIQKNNPIRTPKPQPITKHHKLTTTHTNQTKSKALKRIITNPKQQNLFKDKIRNSQLKKVHKLIWWR
jgi:hypothetical protein